MKSNRPPRSHTSWRTHKCLRTCWGSMRFFWSALSSHLVGLSFQKKTPEQVFSWTARHLSTKRRGDVEVGKMRAVGDFAPAPSMLCVHSLWLSDVRHQQWFSRRVPVWSPSYHRVSTTVYSTVWWCYKEKQPGLPLRARCRPPWWSTATLPHCKSASQSWFILLLRPNPASHLLSSCRRRARDAWLHQRRTRKRRRPGLHVARWVVLQLEFPFLGCEMNAMKIVLCTTHPSLTL